MAISLYSRERSLLGPQNSINALQFSPKGDFLASGDDDGRIYVFDVRDDWSIAHKMSGPSRVTALLWTVQGEEQSLHVGFGDGMVLKTLVTADELSATYLPRSMGEGLIEDLAFVDTTSQLVVCANDKVELWTEVKPAVMAKQTIQHPPGLRTAHPRSVHVVQNGKALLISYLNEGIYRWDIGLREFHQQWHVDPRRQRIGRSALSRNGAFLATSNLYDGFDLYHADDTSYSRTFRQDIVENVPLPVVFIHDSTALLMGSSCGKVAIGDVHTGRIVQELHHDGIIQAVSATEYSDGATDTRLLATGSSEQGTHTTIVIWRATHLVNPGSAHLSSTSLHTEPEAHRASSPVPQPAIAKILDVNPENSVTKRSNWFISRHPVALSTILPGSTQFRYFLALMLISTVISSASIYALLVWMSKLNIGALPGQQDSMLSIRREAGTLQQLWNFGRYRIAEATVSLARAVFEAAMRYLAYMGREI